MKRESSQENGTLKNRMAEAANMPKDVVLGVPIVTLTGQIEVDVENYRGIIEYTDVLIRIKTKNRQIKITGKNLQIAYYTNDRNENNLTCGGGRISIAKGVKPY